MKRFDERDTIFARMSYQKGSREYEDYYKRNPEKKVVDDELRSMPNVGEEGTSTYNQLHSPIPIAGYKFLSDIKKYSEGPINQQQIEVDPEVMTKKIKKLAYYLGANLIGIAKLQDYHYYSHRGRDRETYGQQIDKFHRFGIVFAVEMEKDLVDRAPQFEELLEVTKKYVDAAVIGMWLSYYIRELGYEARNNMDGNYLVIAPLVAEDAGLGEIGRSGILITKEYGPRVRLGVVTTNIPLIPDKKEEFGVKEFCKYCGKCALSCIGNAIPKGKIKEVEGELRWRIDPEKCHRVWRQVGTDCGICLSVCPFSQSVPVELIEKMQGSPEIREKILNEYQGEHGIMAFLKKEINILD
ncbi:4Fe-4S ferredoxin [Vulcanibacillus modesticaldus]|uniref:4Fe-4S ferredoxin n=1 Tax=Vulcanibacillus modesticaldus TaxID=337097 RepID=A0A1D2YWA6_9BACI|nr:reductive dehalogenase domain-containing protein [Vulcanibacillus modesticaldus]OEF99942.1 4Fe-4S ferredoxin [Vulcanibacillus modesticaldus]